MKTSKFLLIAAAALLMSSCSLYNPKRGNSGKTSTTTETTAKVETVKPDKGKKKKNKGPESPAKETASTQGKMPTIDQLQGAQWNITTVAELTIEAEDNAPYIQFGADGRFYAGDGCNIVNGSYVLKSDGKMIFSSVLSTMKYCADVPYADAISAVLSDGNTYSVDCRRIGQETYLYLKDAKGRTAATLRRHNMEFLNGNWRVTSIDGKSIDDEEANIFIDIAELKIHGNTGCNHFNGKLYIDPSRSNAIDFSNMGLTRMACYKGDQERRMMVALEQTATAIAGKNENTVLFLDGAGKQVMTLKRIPVQNMDDK